MTQHKPRAVRVSSAMNLANQSVSATTRELHSFASYETILCGAFNHGLFVVIAW